MATERSTCRFWSAPIVVERRAAPGAASGGQRRLGLARFGLVPHWAKSARVGVRMLNARMETAADKPAYRDAFARRRCIVVADGFYEWKKVGAQKLPLRFVLPGQPLLALAGLWSVWTDPEALDPAAAKVSSFSILTRPAEGAIASMHDRMPVVLPRASYAAWLDRDAQDAEAAHRVLETHVGARLEGYRVSTAVGNVRADGPALIEPVES